MTEVKLSIENSKYAQILKEIELKQLLGGRDVGSDTLSGCLHLKAACTDSIQCCSIYCGSSCTCEKNPHPKG